LFSVFFFYAMLPIPISNSEFQQLAIINLYVISRLNRDTLMRGMSDLFLEDNNATEQLIFKAFHCHREVDDAAQCADLATVAQCYSLTRNHTAHLPFLFQLCVNVG